MTHYYEMECQCVYLYMQVPLKNSAVTQIQWIGQGLKGGIWVNFITNYILTPPMIITQGTILLLFTVLLTYTAAMDAALEA